MFFKSKSKLLIVFDIGASSIRVAIFNSGKDIKPEIIKTFKADINVHSKTGLVGLQKNIYKAFHQVVKEIKISFKDKFNDALISLSSPWYFSQTRIPRTNRDNTFELTEDLVNKILNKESDSIKEESVKKFKVSENELLVLEKDIMKSFLNGYSVSNVFNKKIKKSKLYIYMSVVMEKMVTDISKIIKDELGSKNIHFHTSPFILWNVMRKTFDTEAGFLAVEVSDEVTDVIFVKNGFIEEISSFAIGGNFIIRRLSSFLKISPEEAVSHLKMSEMNELEDTASLTVNKVLKAGSEEWFKLFEQVLRNFYKISPIPERILIFGSSTAVKSFVKTLSSKELKNFVITATEPKINILMPGVFKDRFLHGSAVELNFTDGKSFGLKSTKETILSFLVLFFDQHVKESFNH